MIVFSLENLDMIFQSDCSMTDKSVFILGSFQVWLTVKQGLTGIIAFVLGKPSLNKYT